jgi:hypothetical protein
LWLHETLEGQYWDNQVSTLERRSSAAQGPLRLVDKCSILQVTSLLTVWTVYTFADRPRPPRGFNKRMMRGFIVLLSLRNDNIQKQLTKR